MTALTIRISILILAVIFGGCRRVPEKSIPEKLYLVNSRDRKELTLLFKSFFGRGDFLRVLYADKPMGSIDYNLRLVTYKQKRLKHNRLMVLDNKRWDTWLRYRHLFPMKKYCLIKTQLSLDGFCYGYTLINKERCKTVIHKNLELFQSFSSNSMSTNEIFERLCDGQLFTDEYRGSLNYLYALGLLFGYREDDIRDFVERAKLEQDLADFPFEYSLIRKDLLDDLQYMITHKDHFPIQKTPQISIERLELLSSSLVLQRKMTLSHQLYPLQISYSMSTIPQEDNPPRLAKKFMEIYYSDNFLEQILEELAS